MIAGAHRSVPPLRVGLRAHQTQDAIPVIVLREIQLARPAEEKRSHQKQRTTVDIRQHNPLKVFKVEVLLLSMH